MKPNEFCESPLCGFLFWCVFVFCVLLTGHAMDGTSTEQMDTGIKKKKTGQGSCPAFFEGSINN